MKTGISTQDWDDMADALFEASKTNPEIITKEDYMTIKVKPDFEPDRSFETVQEAIDYCNEQPNPMYALGAIVGANCEMGEFGFAGDLVHEGDQIIRK